MKENISLSEYTLLRYRWYQSSNNQGIRFLRQPVEISLAPRRNRQATKQIYRPVAVPHWWPSVQSDTSSIALMLRRSPIIVLDLSEYEISSNISEGATGFCPRLRSRTGLAHSQPFAVGRQLRGLSEHGVFMILMVMRTKAKPRYAETVFGHIEA